MIKSLFTASSLIILSLLASCTSNKKLTKELVYFDGLADSSRTDIKVEEVRIEKNDLLYIGISTGDPKTDAILNSPTLFQNNQQNSPGSSTSMLGYLVDDNGNIILPEIGQISVEGKTKDEIIEIVKSKASLISKNPMVTVRVLNYKITVLGEVARPGSFSIPNERVNVLEAIGLAGDLTPFGKRNNVLVIREANGKREYARLDLGKPGVFNSPYFQLKQNDIVYIELNDRKIGNVDQTSLRTFGIITGALTTIAIVITAIAATTK